MSDPKDRRAEPRVPTKIDVDVTAEGTYLFAQITDISSLGIFVHVDEPSPKGSILRLSFAPPTEVRSQLADPDVGFELEGEVMWTSSPDGPHPAGMGVRFVQLDEATRQRLLELVTAIAYFD